MSELKRTQLYDVHVAAGATMVDFGGWEMPIQYPSGIIAEHLYTRQVCSLFDVSHMGRLLVEGPQRKEFLQHVLTSNVSALDLNMAQYCIIPNENGGAVDDAYLYLFQEDNYLLVVNAANIDKDLEHLNRALSGFDCTITNISDQWASIAVQGPKSKEMLMTLTGGVSPTKEPTKNKTRAGKLAAGSYHVNADGTDITGVSFPVKVLTPWALKNAKQVTDADSYDITVTLKGKESTTTYTGVDALFVNESYAYYKLSETPAYYITAWYNLLSGKWEFGKVHATETTVEGTTVELNTNGHHATYEMKISGFDLDYKANKVYGVVLTTADGSEYGLHHVTNIWHGTKLGFNADDPYFASVIGKTITQITFYAADGVYVLPVNVAL